MSRRSRRWSRGSDRWSSASAGSMLDDPHDVEDAFQATFLILVRKAGTIRDGDLLGNWLYGVAYRVATRARVNVRRRHSAKWPGRRRRPWLHASTRRRTARAARSARRGAEPATREVPRAALPLLPPGPVVRGGRQAPEVSDRHRSQPVGQGTRVDADTTRPTRDCITRRNSRRCPRTKDDDRGGFAGLTEDDCDNRQASSGGKDGLSDRDFGKRRQRSHKR